MGDDTLLCVLYLVSSFLYLEAFVLLRLCSHCEQCCEEHWYQDLLVRTPHKRSGRPVLLPW